MENKLLLFIKDFNLTVGEQVLFKNFSLDVFAGEIIGFFAPTGSGKTSLFNHIAGTSAVVEPKSAVGEPKSAVVEPVETTISYVFQEPRLIPSLTVLKNVMLPLENKMKENDAKDLAIQWLEKLNMGHKINDLAKTLSGGEQQRTAIARAFAYSSAVPMLRQAQQTQTEGLLLLDEPFASQDEINTTNIVNLIKQIISSQHCACLVISHDSQVLESFCSRIITSQDFLN